MKINENNRFYKARKEIQQIANSQGVTSDVACTMYARKHWGDYGWQRELDEFNKMLISLQRQKHYDEKLDKNGDGEITGADLYA